MTKLSLLFVPDKRLKTVCAKVDKIDDELIKTLDEMADLMYKEEGIGLAGPQVGFMKRVFVCDPECNPDRKNFRYIINPEIIWSSDREETRSEACLSIPDVYVEMTRPAEIKLKYLDEKGQEQVLKADQLLARLFQHEHNHLDGIILTDFLGPMKKKMALAKVQKIVKLRQKHHTPAQDNL